MNRIVQLLALSLLVLLTACEGPMSTAKVVDNGTTALAPYPGYSLHGFDVQRGGGGTDKLYVVEKDGIAGNPATPVAGTSIHSGKRNDASVVIDKATTVSSFHCDSVDECRAQLAAVDAAAAVPKAPFHCDSVDECKTKLLNIQQTE